MKTFRLFFLVLLTVTSARAQERAQQLFDSGQLAALQQHLQQSNVTEGDRHFWTGRIALANRNYDEAATSFEKAVGTNENNARYQLYLGNTYAQQAVEGSVITKGLLAPKIRNTFEQVVRLDPSNEEALKALINFYSQAPAMMGGDPKRAVALGRQLKGVNPVAGSLALADLYVQQKQPDAAEDEFKNAVRLDPRSYRTAYVAATYFVKTKQYGRAFELYENFLKQNPGQMLATYQLGKLAALSGTNLQRGEESLMAYIRQHKPVQDDPSHAAAVMRIGMIYEKKAQLEQAKKYYQMALKMDANLKDAQEGLARL